MSLIVRLAGKMPGPLVVDGDLRKAICTAWPDANHRGSIEEVDWQPPVLVIHFATLNGAEDGSVVIRQLNIWRLNVLTNEAKFDDMHAFAFRNDV